jgi:hypothetical protein
MVRTLDHIVDEAEFEKNYKSQASPRAQKDVFFIWMVLMVLSVVGAHFMLNVSGSSMTGYVTATQDPVENVTIMLDSMFVLFITILVGALIFIGVNQRKY